MVAMIPRRRLNLQLGDLSKLTIESPAIGGSGKDPKQSFGRLETQHLSALRSVMRTRPGQNQFVIVTKHFDGSERVMILGFTVAPVVSFFLIKLIVILGSKN